VATRLDSFIDYHRSEAWTWEHLAMTRARVLTGPPKLRAAIESEIRAVLARPRERAKVIADVREMRERIFKEKGSDDIWELKHTRGGLVDLEFIAQSLQLIHGASHPYVLDQNTRGALVKLADAGLLERQYADALLPANDLLHGLTQVLRLCLDGRFDPAKAPDGLLQLLAQAGQCPDFASLEARLRECLAEVADLFDRIVA
jgi:glutamate-ammonia-ligase adenylyltransferase